MNSSNFQAFVMYFRKLESEMIPLCRGKFGRLPWVVLALLAASSWINPDIPDSLGVALPEPGSASGCLAWTSQSCDQSL